MRCLVIADDFTGANDTGMQLARRGYRTEVFFQMPEVTKPDTSVIIDTESRQIGKTEAYEKVREMLQTVNLEEYTYVIKKVDSTLRGNIAWEIKAVDEQFQSELVIFMPALPSLGRTTVNGVHCLNGVPVSQTELGKDPGSPVRQDNIVKLLEDRYEETVHHISIESLKKSTPDFSKGRVFAVDAETDRQMQMTVSAALQTGKRVLFIGTAALMDAVLEIKCPNIPALGLIGSISEVTRRQIHYAGEHGCQVLQVQVGELMVQKKTVDTYVDQAAAILKKGEDLLIVSDASWDRAAYDQTISIAQEMGMSSLKAGAYTQQVLSEIGQKILKDREVSGVFLAGGDTAMGLFQALGANGSEIIGEIAAGIPIMELRGGRQEGLRIVTKAGAFGNPDAIVYGLRKLKEGQSRSNG